MKTYVIGAGCSRNYSEGVTQIPGLVPPLDKDFFRMAKKVISLNGYSWLYSIDHLTRDIERLYGVRYEDELEILNDPRLSLETVLTLFQMREDLFGDDFSQFGVLRNLQTGERRIAMLIQVIATTIYEALRGPICSKHIKLAEKMNENDFIINFNYDILMDLALRLCDKFNDQSYLLNFYKVFNGEEWVAQQADDPKIIMAKLHGSLNWLHCSHCNSVLLLRDQKVGDWYATLPNTEICPRCYSSFHLFERMLIPPLLVKKYSEPNIRYLWNESLKKIGQSMELIFIGYSLPPTDFATETLFRAALEKKQRDIPVSIINPDPSIVKRYSAIFNPNNIQHYETLDDFLLGF